MAAVCNACGKQWTRHPALASAFGEVECLVCNAAVGVGCSRSSGHSGPFIEPHVEREQRAVDEGVLELCTASAIGEGPTRKAASPEPKQQPGQQLALV